MFSVKRKIATATAIGLTVFATLLSAAPANANQIDTPPSGVTVNHNSPNYDVTIDCDNLPFGGGELFTGATQRGTYTLHMAANCQDSANYIMGVDDNGDTAEIGGYTVGGVFRTTASNIAIPATMTLKPDTFVTVSRVGQPSEFFNIRYNGSDPSQTAPEPTTTPLANTGFDSGYYLLLAGGLISLGLGSRVASRALKRTRK